MLLTRFIGRTFLRIDTPFENRMETIAAILHSVPNKAGGMTGIYEHGLSRPLWWEYNAVVLTEDHL